MQIIPVIDLKDGLVVHAVRGDRANYQAIHRHSILTNTSDIHAVLNAFLSLYPFKGFYIADLNAIIGDGNHDSLIQMLAQRYPDIDFWLDNGSQLSAVTHNQRNLKWVIGTESQHSPPEASNRDFILSLDFKNEVPAGQADWFSESQFWPDTVIIMTLSRVGSNIGPDFEKLAEFRHAHPSKRLVAAGGTRDRHDLIKLKSIGVDAALLATSLHSGQIGKDDIQNL